MNLKELAVSLYKYQTGRNLIIIGLTFMSIAGLMLTGCSGEQPANTQNEVPVKPVEEQSSNSNSGTVSKSTPNGRIQAEWIDVEKSGEAVSISLDKVNDYFNTHFKFVQDSSELTFMAYLLDGEIHVRANVCPPCRSIGYSLDNGVLICDRCATAFKADTGDGIQGACVDFPKASVNYQIEDGSVVMKSSDLQNAYEATMKPGWP